MNVRSAPKRTSILGLDASAFAFGPKPDHFFFFAAFFLGAFFFAAFFLATFLLLL